MKIKILDEIERLKRDLNNLEENYNPKLLPMKRSIYTHKIYLSGLLYGSKIVIEDELKFSNSEKLKAQLKYIKKELNNLENRKYEVCRV